MKKKLELLKKRLTVWLPRKQRQNFKLLLRQRKMLAKKLKQKLLVSLKKPKLQQKQLVSPKKPKLKQKLIVSLKRPKQKLLVLLKKQKQ